jgi:pSer/pThr/pTyr-binding forkhead associated (FHA) protein
MEARLVQIEADRPTSTTPLSRPEMLIGRDPAADVVVEFSRVSRRHAVVRELGGRHTIADLGSSNGTTVNGAPVRDAVLLEPGDRIALGEEVIFLYEPVPPARRVPLVAIAAGALVVVALAAGAAVWRCSRPDATFQQAL